MSGPHTPFESRSYLSESDLLSEDDVGKYQSHDHSMGNMEKIMDRLIFIRLLQQR